MVSTCYRGHPYENPALAAYAHLLVVRERAPQKGLRCCKRRALTSEARAEVVPRRERAEQRIKGVR